MAIDNIRSATGAGGLDAYGKIGSEKDRGKDILEMLMTKKENISSEIKALEAELKKSEAENQELEAAPNFQAASASMAAVQANKAKLTEIKAKILALKYGEQDIEEQIKAIKTQQKQTDPAVAAEQLSTSSATAPTPGGESSINLSDEAKKATEADKTIQSARETQSVKSLINEINTKPITAETAKNYFEAAAGKDAKWLKDNIWSKTNMGELETLSEKLSLMEGSSSDTINSPSGPIPNPLNNKEIRLQTLELKNYISETKENTDIPEAIQKYDADKSGKITEDEVKNIDKFQKDLSGLSVDEQKHIIRQHLSYKLKTDLLEKLFKKKR